MKKLVSLIGLVAILSLLMVCPVQADDSAELRVTVEVVPPPPPPGGGGGGVFRDTKPPRIYDIGLCPEGVTETTADICWTTNEKSTGQIEYWTSPSMLSPLDEAYVLEHHIQLANLTPGTTYYYIVMSKDKAGNLAVSDEYTFTTLEKEPIPPEPEEPIKPEEPEEPEEPIEPEKPIEPEEPEPEAETPWGLIGGILGGLAVLAGGVAYWLRRKKPNNDD